MENIELSDELLSSINDYMLAKGLAYKTRKEYNYTLKRITKRFGIMNDEVCRTLLKEFKHQNQRAVLLLINNYCYHANIDFKINVPSMVRQKKKITIKTLSLEEIEIMIKAAPKPWDLMIKCIFKIGGGLRISEAIKLSWNHFFWADWLKNNRLGAVLIKDSKGDDRIVPLPKSLMEELYELAKEREITNEFGIPKDGIIFPTTIKYKKKLRGYDLEQWKIDYVLHSYNWFRYNILKKYCEPALGHPIRIHSLRHSRATQLYEDDVPIDIIQKLLGHKEITTTMIYADVSRKKVFEAMEKID